MESANEFFSNMMSSGKNFNKCKVGKVVEFDAKKMKANIQPLPSESNSLLINVPVMTFKTGSFFIRLPLEVGDIVVVLFADNDLDNILLGGDNLATERKHDLSDSICIGGITLFAEKLTDEHTDDLVIGTKDMKANLTITKNGDININAENISIKAKNRADVNGGTQSSTWR